MAFWNAKLSEINIPSELQTIGYGAFVGCDCNFKVSPGNKYFATIGNGLYNKTNKELIAANEGELVIPEGIVSIGDYACYGRWSTKLMVLPSTLKQIGSYAFYASTIYYRHEYRKEYLGWDFIFPSQLETIGDYAFAKSKWIKDYSQIKVYFPNSIKSIGESAFEEVDSDWSALYIT